MNAIIYARVSTDEQANRGYSLPSQIEACQKYAHEKGFIVPDDYVFTDDISGALFERPGLDQVRELVKRDSSAKALFVYDLDRLSRKLAHQLILEEEFAKRGVQIHYVLGQFDDSPEGKFQKQIRSAVAEYEREKIKERSARGKRTMAKAGVYVPHSIPSYGYRHIKSDGHTVLMIDEEEGRIIHLIFIWYTQGDESGQRLSFWQIAKKLTEIGIASPGVARGSRRKKSAEAHWQAMMIGRIIKNPMYAGTWYYGRSMGPSTERQRRPKEQWIPVKVPAIIDRELWDAAQKIVAENHHRTQRYPENHYLMQGKLQCAHCHYKFAGVTHHQPGGHSYAYYVCAGLDPMNSNHWHDKKCAARYVRVDMVDTCVWEFIQEIFQNPEKLLKGMRAKQAEQQETYRLLTESVEVLDKEISSCRKQLENLIDLATTATSEMSKTIFREKEAAINQRIASLEREHAEFAEKLEDAIISDEVIESIEVIASEVRERLPKATFEDKRWLVEVLEIHCQVETLDARKSRLVLSCVIKGVAMKYIVERFKDGKVQKEPESLQQSNIVRLL